MQSTTIKVLAVLIILIVFGLGGYMFATKTSFSSLIKTPGVTKSTTLVSLVADNTPQICEAKENGVQATYYFADGNIYGVFRGNGANKYYMLAMGDNTYQWYDGATTGFILPYNSGQGDVDEAVIPTGFNSAYENFNYSCRPWTKDDSIFRLPSNITFGSIPSESSNNSSSTGSGILFTPN